MAIYIPKILKLAFVALFLLVIAIIVEKVIKNPSNDENVFVVAYVMREIPPQVSGLSIRAKKFENECFVPEVFSSEWNVRSLSAKSVLAWLDHFSEDGTKQGRFILVNVNSCKHQVIYNGVLSEKYQIFTNNNPSDERFTLMMRGKKFCQGHDYCRLHFNPLFEKLQPFDFDFPLGQLDDIYPAMPSNPNLFVVCHTDDTNTHRIRLYDLSSDETILNYKELLALPNYTSLVNNARVPQYELLSSRLSVCWRKLKHDSMTVHCSEFTEKGNVAFEKKADFPESKTLQPHGKALPSMVILSVVFECFEKKDFSKLHVTIALISNMIERAIEIRGDIDESQWNKLLNSITSRSQRNSLVYLQSEEDLRIFEPSRRFFM